MFGGGKGANQAVAAARAGGAITFLGAYGPADFRDGREKPFGEGRYQRRLLPVRANIAERDRTYPR